MGFVVGGCAAPTFDRPGISPEGQAFFILMESVAYLTIVVKFNSKKVFLLRI